MTTFVPSTDALVVRVQSCFEEIAEGSAVFARMTTAALPNGTPAGVPMPQMPTPQQFAAAMPQMPAPQLLEPNTVATQFVQQYYHVLSNWPGNLHRFYTEHSSLTHSAVGGESVRIRTQRGIHEKVMSLGLTGAVPQIMSVDSQASLGGGVVVHTTGYLTLVNAKKPKAFAQVFFLAQQENGYYVLNDLFCWLHEPNAMPEPEKKVGGVKQAPAAAAEKPKPAAAAPAIVPAEAKKVRSQTLPDPADAKAAEVSQVPAPVQPQQAVPTPDAIAKPAAAGPAKEPAAAASNEARPSAPAEAPLDPGAPMTYAQRLKMAAAKPALMAEPAAAPAPKAGRGPADPSVAAAAATEENGQPDSTTIASIEEVDARSLFVRNLPHNVTEERLAAELSKHGPVEGGARGVSLKQNAKSFYAFVEMASAQVAAGIISGGKIELDGKVLEVMMKKPTILNNKSKGRRRGKVRPPRV